MHRRTAGSPGARLAGPADRHRRRARAQRDRQRLVRLALLAGGRARLPRGRPADDRGAAAQRRDDRPPPAGPAGRHAQLVDAVHRRARCGSPTRCPPSPTPGRPSASGCSASRSCGWRARSRSASAARSAAGTRSACRPCSGPAASASCCSSSTALCLLFDRPLQQALARQGGADRRGRKSPHRTGRRPHRHPTPRRLSMTRRLTRADLDALPSYVPGRSPADLARELGLPEAIKLASNEVPYGPLPGVVEAVTEAAAGVAPLPGHGRGRAARRAGRAVRREPPTGSPPAAARWRWPSTWPGPPACPATRSSTRGARSRRTRSSRRPPARPACGCPTTPATGTTSTAMAAAITDRTRHGAGLQPQQPDRYERAPRRARPLPRRRAGRRAGGARRGVPRVRHRPRRARRPRGLRRPAQRGGAADAVQGVGPGRPADRLPGRPARGRRGRAQGGHPVLDQRRRPGRRARRAPAGRGGTAALRARGRRARAGHRGGPQARARTSRPVAGQLRLAAAGRPVGRVRRRLREAAA